MQLWKKLGILAGVVRAWNMLIVVIISLYQGSLCPDIKAQMQMRIIGPGTSRQRT